MHRPPEFLRKSLSPFRVKSSARMPLTHTRALGGRKGSILDWLYSVNPYVFNETCLKWVFIYGVKILFTGAKIKSGSFLYNLNKEHGLSVTSEPGVPPWANRWVDYPCNRHCLASYVSADALTLDIDITTKCTNMTVVYSCITLWRSCWQGSIWLLGFHLIREMREGEGT